MANTPLDIRTPMRSDHRVVKKVLSMLLGSKVEHIPEEYDYISDKFSEVGGSWVSLHEGSVEQMVLLKKLPFP